MKTKSVFGICLLAAFSAVAERPDVQPDVAWRLRLDEAIARATGENPGLKSMEARIEAARHKVRQATALPDPEVEVGIKDIPPANPSLTRSDFTMQMVSARQRFPGSGKRSAQHEVADAEVANQTALYDIDFIRTSADVADSFFQVAALDRRVQILEGTRNRLGDVAASAMERYRVGRVSQGDVLRANLERTSLEDQILSMKADRRAQVARLNTLQALPANAEFPPLSSVEPEAALPPLDRIAEDAVERSPAVRAAEAQVRRSEADLAQARLERRPDLMVTGYYGRRERFEDLAGASIAINLPFAHPRRLDEKRAEMDAMVTAAKATLTSTRNQIRSDIESALADLEKNLAQARLYRDSILPQAEINFRSAREAYVVGQIDFLTYVRSATDLSMYEGEQAIRSAGVGRALAALQKASGRPLFTSLPRIGDSHEIN